jgi:NADH-quinone oxidoreductase subunit L
VAAIDGALVNGAARLVSHIAGVVRHLQTGYIYHYAFAMIVGVLLLATWFARG